MGILDLIFPKRCVGCRRFGSYICSTCFAMLSFSDEATCAVCNRHAIDGRTHPGCMGKYTIDGIISSMSYKGLMKRLVYQFKYKPYLSDLEHILSDLFLEGLIQKELFHTIVAQKPVLIPIPLHRKKLRSRGYNQAGILAKNLGKALNLPMAEALIRQKETDSQFQLTREARVKNISSAFEIKKEFKNRIKGKFFLLIDDVTTSGVTFLEAAKVLKKTGAKSVWGIALAHGN